MHRAASCVTSRCAILLLAFGAALGTGCAVGSGPPPEEPADAAAVTTEVIEYTPAPASARIVRSGYCTGPSEILDGRRDAWRCVDDERIADPCFETPGVITCGVNPVQDDGGYQLQLVEPLPERADDDHGGSSRFWLIELVDGTLCGVAKGADESLEGERVTYRCAGGTVLLGTIAAGDPFTARQILAEELGRAATSLDQSREVAVRRAWR